MLKFFLMSFSNISYFLAPMMLKLLKLCVQLDIQAHLSLQLVFQILHCSFLNCVDNFDSFFLGLQLRTKQGNFLAELLDLHFSFSCKRVFCYLGHSLESELVCFVLLSKLLKQLIIFKPLVQLLKSILQIFQSALMKILN